MTRLPKPPVLASVALAAIVRFCARHARAVVLVAVLLAITAGAFTARKLSITTDVNEMFSSALPWKQRDAELKRALPQFENMLVVVIDAAIPEEADATAADLADALVRNGTHFLSVRRPDASPYFDRNGLLFLGRPQLADLLDRTVDSQPFLGQLAADPSLRGLLGALSLIAEGIERDRTDLSAFEPGLRAFHATLADAAAGRSRPLSWETLVAGPVVEQAGRFRIILAQPRLDFDALQPGGAATRIVRDVAAGLEFVRAGTARVRITGEVALNDEEFATAAKGAAAGLAGSFALVVLWLFLAVRSWRVVVPVAATLLLGLLLTTGFAALAVGTLNVVSVAFAILFVGIAVDFAIQFAVRFQDVQRNTPGLATALAETARQAGTQVLVAAAATSAGFLALTPTSFAGVAQLGLIAGGGMLVAFACTLTMLPAMLALCRPQPSMAEVGLVWAQPVERLVVRCRGALLLLAGGLAVLALILLPRLTFDGDPLHTKDPDTEAMRTLADLVNDPLINPYSMDVLLPSLAAADEVAARLRPLPLVQDVLTLGSLVPEDQDAKLALIRDAEGLLAATLAPRPNTAPVTAKGLRAAVRAAAPVLAKAVRLLPAGHPFATIAHDLKRLATAPDANLLVADAALVRFLPAQLDWLRTALEASRVTQADIPPTITRDWVLPDGRAHLQAVPARGARDTAGLRRFLREVRTVLPEPGGSAAVIVASADSITGAFRIAALSAVLAIGAILLVALRRLLDVGLVLAALLLAALLTVLATLLLSMPLNFANIIALPLLLGIGVSFNIYFVMNWRAGIGHRLASATARAVVFSALTTGTAFGSLALSPHPGTASMGTLLLVSLGCTLLASLVFLPAMLAFLPQRR